MPQMRRRELLQRSASALLAMPMAVAGRAALAEAAPQAGLVLNRLAVQRADEGLLLSYDVRFDLPDDIESALGKGVAVTFVARAELLRPRWYWLDQTRARAVRRWRLAYQPLTRHWRVSFDGLSRQYNQLGDALDALRRTNRWRIAEPVAYADEQDYEVAFRFMLDPNELPRPLQIGLGGQPNWNVSVERRVPVPPV
ncbi:DUF4390 domain-containing protein [uncultured Aquabacterium sp.]|uniref:DUF4390 domain-containing protein n=1 Tax=uncultured Aquabacterium sp. TaxID=158753 RepID=UPI00262C1951|nr:DUF4390 domain-containing protein [uncultured Aquabacterium sp.]